MRVRVIAGVRSSVCAGLLAAQVEDERFHNIHAPPEPWTVAPCRATDLLVHYMEPRDWAHIDDSGVLSC